MRYLHTLDYHTLKDFTMAWKFRYPQRDDYESEEEYQEACDAYEYAEDCYAERDY